MSKAGKPKDGARRRAPRLPIHLEGSLAGRVSHRITVVDISMTGALVRCDALLDHGAILDLGVDMGGGERLAAKVQVTDAYVDGEAAPGEPARCLAGLAFLSLPVQEETRLHRFLDEERRRRQSADPPAR